MIRLIQITVVFLFYFNILPAQTNHQIPDSLIRQLKSASDTQQINLLNKYADATYQKDFDKAKTILDSTLDWSVRIKFIHGEAKARKLLGLVSYFKGDYEKATRYYIESISLYEKSGDLNGEAEVCNEIGNLLRKHDDVNGAIKYMERAMLLYEKSNNTDGLANTNNNMGVICEYLGKLDSAMTYYQKALALYKSIGSNTGMGYSLDYIGLIHFYQGHIDEAIQSLTDALNIREKQGEKQAMAVSLVNLGELCLNINRLDDAKNYCTRSLALAKEQGFPDLISYNYKMLSEIAAKKNDYKTAFDLHKTFTQINDSIFNLKRNEQIAEMQAKYETEKKEKDNIKLSNENNEKELRIVRQRVSLSILTGILIIGALSMFLFYNRNKLQQQQLLNEEIQRQEKLRLKAIIESQENERQRIAADLHDGLGQLLSAARVNLASTEVVNENNSQNSKTLQLIDQSCKELREISHNMMPSLLANAGLIPALEEMISSINATGKIQIELDAERSELGVDPDKSIQLFRIIQELIQNILKYASASEVQIQFLKVDNNLIMMVEDNGKGFDTSTLSETSGNGLYNIRTRLTILNGTMEIDSKPGNGTVVTIEIPVV